MNTSIERCLGLQRLRGHGRGREQSTINKPPALTGGWGCSAWGSRGECAWVFGNGWQRSRTRTLRSGGGYVRVTSRVSCTRKIKRLRESLVGGGGGYRLQPHNSIARLRRCHDELS